MKRKFNFDILLVGLLSIICLLVFFDFIFLKKVYLFKDIGSDTINAVYPHLIHISEYLRTEGIPRWSFAQGLGQNITNSGIDNPFNWLLYLLGREHLAYGIVFIEIFKILLTAWLCYRWLLVLFKNHLAALFGGIAFGLSGYMIVGGAWYVHSWLCLKIILLFWAFEKGYRHQVWLWWVLAVFWSFDVNFVFIAPFFLIYLLFRLTLQDDTFKNRILATKKEAGFSFNQKRNTFWGLLKPMISYAVLGVAMKAPLIGSMFYRIWDSPRLQEDFSAGNDLWNAPFFESALHYTTVFLRTIGNDLLGNGSHYIGWKNYLEAPLLYCGIITILLIPQAFVFMNKKERLAYGFLLAFWLLIIIFPYLRYSYYLFSGDYYKIAVSIFFPVTCLLCACRAIVGFQQHKKINLKLLYFTSTIILIGLISSCFVVNYTPFHLLSLSFIFIILIVFTALHKNSFQYKWSIHSIVLLLCLEMLCVNYFTVNQRVAMTSAELNERVGYNDYTLEALDFIKKNDAGFYRISKRFSSGLSKNRSLNDGKAQGFFGTSAYSSFNQGHYVNFLTKMNVIQAGNESESRWIMGLHLRPNLEKLVSLKYVFGKATLKNNELIKVGFFGDKTLFKKTETMPLGFVYTRYFPEKSFMRLADVQKDCAILNAVVLPDSVGKTYNSFLERFIDPIKTNCFPKLQDQLKLSDFSQNKLIFEGSHPAGIFFASIPFDLGWESCVKCGEKIQSSSIININFGFLGIVLPNVCENARIELTYKPPFATIGLIVAILAWSLLVCLFFINRKKKLI